jgi:hypothetical protein
VVIARVLMIVVLAGVLVDDEENDDDRGADKDGLVDSFQESKLDISGALVPEGPPAEEPTPNAEPEVCPRSTI